jgi:hypothetical protein
MNKIICPICYKENFVLDFKCADCGSIIRENYRTINLGETLKDLLFNPEFAIKKILFSEHKNYLFFLLALLGLKITVLFFYLNSIYDQDINVPILSLSFYVFSYYIIFIFLLGLIFQLIIKLITRHNIHYKNSLSIIVYSFSYFSIMGFILFILEMMLFGVYFFSRNPNIFQINSLKAIAVVGLEVILFFYSSYLFINFLVFILQKKFIALILFIVFFISFYIGSELLKKIIGIN